MSKIRLTIWLSGLLLLGLLSLGSSAVQVPASLSSLTVAQLPSAVDNKLKIYVVVDGASPTDCSSGGGANILFCRSNGADWIAIGGGEGNSVPSGSILIIDSGTCPVGYSEVTALDGKTLLGTTAATGNVGTTGGADSITPTGTNGGGAVSVHSGSAVAEHASHTHSYTETVNHTHGFTDVRGNTTGGATTAHGFTEGNDTSSSLTSTVTGNPSGGVATGTTTGPSAALSHQVTQSSAHSFTQPVFTGTQFDNRSAFARCIFCRKN